ncbi:MAG: phosphatidylserine decarboxylase family protein [Bacteroidales bacterium]
MRIHKEGITTILLVFLTSAIISFLLLFFSSFSIWSIVVSSILLIVTLFIITFFRFPYRFTPGTDKVVTAGADGKIVLIQEIEEPEYFKDTRLQISIYMNFFNIHANWYPITGKITYFKYHPGAYFMAFHPKASVLNERTSIIIENKDKQEVLCRQIAGKFAKRIISYTEEGQYVKAGDDIGFIKFGSRCDVFLPLGSKVLVKLGDNVKGSESILARLV